MAVDANVLVFERIREEFSHSGRIASSVHAGYRKAFTAIFDSNFTIIIAALILLQFDSGPIKGLAITLLIGIISSMLTALFMTRYYFYPARKFAQTPTPLITPDLILEKKEGSWTIRTADEFLPHFTLSTTAHMSNLRSKGRSILLALQKRRVTLEKIGHFLLKKQKSFFEDKERMPQPLSIKETSEELGMHFSTIARAVRDKYLFCPQGLLPLTFFLKARTSNQMKQLLAKLVQKEGNPLTDEELMQKLQAEGVTCARRTVSKYRRLLSIPSAAVRRQLNLTTIRSEHL